LTAGSSTTLALGAGDFTIETWVYLTSYNTNSSCVFDYRTNGGSPSNIPALFIGPSGILALYTNIPSGTLITGSTAVSLNTWTHLAIVRSGTATSNVKMYLNGVNIGSGTTTSTLGIETFAINNAALSPGNIYILNGYISNFRIVKGVAVYTGAFTPPTSPLAATQSAGTNISAITGTATSLLTCQSNRFKDNSTNAFAITVNGTPRVDPYFYPSGFTAPAASPGAALFNGTSQYLTSTTGTTVFQFGSNPYTIEGWVYQATRPARQWLCGGVFSGATYQVAINASGFIFGGVTGIGDLPAATIAVPLNAWTHFAIVRTSTSSSGGAYYINGVPAGTFTDSSNISGTNSAVNVGTTNNDGSIGINGYIGNFRIVKGTAVYTGAFTPPSGLLTQTGGTYPSLTNVVTGFSAANTSLLLAMSDSNYNSATNGVQNNTFIDESNYAFPITRNGTPTQGSITPYWPNGQWSNYFNGSSQLTLPNNAGFEIGAGDFSYEAFVYATVATNTYAQGILSYGIAGSVGSSVCTMQISSTGFFGVGYATGSALTLTDPASFPVNQWVHCVFCRSGSTLSIFVNGVRKATTTTSATVGTGGVMVIGGQWYVNESARQLQNGYISNARVLKGASAYDATLSTLTVPTAPLPTNTANQQLLTCYSNRFIDANTATTAKTINLSGTPTVQAFQPFSPTASYTTALYGGSGYFNGSTDYLTAPASSALTLTADFTIEFWVYSGAFASGASNPSLFNTSPASIFYESSGSNRGLCLFVGSAIITTATTVLPNNQWNHVVCVRSGSTVSMFVNGSRVGTNASFSSTADFSSAFINRYFGSAAGYLNGYMSNFRVVKGTAVYDPTLTTLTVPTAPVTAVTNTSLLLNFTNAGIYDAAAQNDVLTVGSAVTDTTTKQWSPSSTFLNGSANYLTMPATPQWAMSGDWTLEAWIYPTTVSGVQIIINTRNLSAVTSPVMYLNGSSLVIDTGAAPVISAGTISINSWQYVAATRSGNSWKLFINGGQVGSTTTNTTSYSTAYGCAIGRSSAGENFNGYIQDVRVTKGVARTITASPSAAFPTR
jgi:hypothetical protein